ncbi:MAG: ASCH domain-containing protein [Candidatus Baltobacteraceae bacterium]
MEIPPNGCSCDAASPSAPLAVPPTRALSIRQPWAWAILYGGKRVENRTWYTSFRGRIFIHAGLTVDREAFEGLEDVIRAVPAPRPPAVCGALIGLATIVDCVEAHRVPPHLRDWVTGPWCLILDDVVSLEAPFPLRGRLGLFPVAAGSISQQSNDLLSFSPLSVDFVSQSNL